MRQKLVLEAPIHDRWVDSEEIDLNEDRLNEEQPWEIAFEEGERMANKEMVDNWLDEDDW